MKRALITIHLRWNPHMARLGHRCPHFSEARGQTAPEDQHAGDLASEEKQMCTGMAPIMGALSSQLWPPAHEMHPATQ